ncbi:MAG: hypothetical protein D4R98_07045 [Comamonadaceae bacterium]|nr:MAG: hypothetical protein D4R98_07045 [Comamonadaceae bacterium]
MINNSQLKSLGFKLTHEIVESRTASSLPEFQEVAAHPSLKKSSVYLWLSPLPSSSNYYEVLYVGKAGYGTTRRFSQHKGGFRKTSPGSNHALIREKFEAKRKILVFGKVADEIDLFGVTVSRYSTEEEALCKHLSPLWNRAGFPDSAKPKKSANKAKTKSKTASKFVNSLEEDTSLWFEELKLENQDRFSRILSYAEGINFLREMPQKIIGGYTSQPAGYSGIPMIVYGRFTTSGRVAPNGWFLRIPQPTSKASNLTLFIPQCFLDGKVNHARIAKHGTSRQEFFYPLDVDHFLLNPEEYVDWNKLDTRSAQKKKIK